MRVLTIGSNIWRMLIAQTHAHTHILGLIGKIPISHREAFSVSLILQLCPNMCVKKEGCNYLHIVFMGQLSPILITVVLSHVSVMKRYTFDSENCHLSIKYLSRVFLLI